MGIQDRDYYRDDEPSWWSTAAQSRVTYGLIVLLVAVFVTQVLGSNPRRGDAALDAAQFEYAAVTRGQVWRLVTSHFVHRRDALVLVGLTAWGLYYFGSRVEAHYGSAEYATYLAATVLLVSAAKVLVAGLTGFEADVPTHGSLALLWGVLVLALGVSPRSQPILGLEVPTVVLLLLVMALALGMESEGRASASGLVGPPLAVAWSLAYSKLDPRLARRLRVDRLFGAGRPARLKVFRTPPESPRDRAGTSDQAAREILATPTRATPAAATASLDEQLEAKLDQVLEKVSRSGKDSLTSDEQNILRRASEIYKQRRGV